jgi:long-subunit acyl-CoA synthetase (AMP-forming)
LHLDKHLVTLPLSILLENLCGIYIPLLLAAETVILPPSRLGFEGCRFHPAPFLQALTTWRPHSLVLVPELLRVLLHLHSQVPDSTQSLRFVAVGGGKVPPSLLTLATQYDLPVYEGYGLSECGSVVALNLPGSARDSSVGHPLPGLKSASMTSSSFGSPARPTPWIFGRRACDITHGHGRSGLRRRNGVCSYPRPPEKRAD